VEVRGYESQEGLAIVLAGFVGFSESAYELKLYFLQIY
jgi:hypothetical protein